MRNSRDRSGARWWVMTINISGGPYSAPLCSDEAGGRCAALRCAVLLTTGERGWAGGME